MTSETSAKKDIQKLQRAIVDGLEDVKAQDIQVFNTEHLSPLFERVIMATGSSNRQTKALAASVRDAVREAGFGKPRMEGEANGEWIIVDCGPAVAHIMQPTIRTYYSLEELWGDKPVRLKFGAAKPAAPEPARPARKAVVKKAAQPKAATTPAKRTGVAQKTVAKADGSTSLRRSSAVKTAARVEKAATRAPTKTATRTATRAAAKPTTRAPAKAPVKAPVKKAASRKS